MGTDVSLGFHNLTREIFAAYSPNQYFSQEIGSDVKSGAGVKRAGELYRHEKRKPIRNRKSDVSSFRI
jgi:hypothetical protein